MKSMYTFPVSSFVFCLMSIGLSACQTTSSSPRVVDERRGEVTISTSGDKNSSLAVAFKDESLTQARVKLEERVKTRPSDIKAMVSLAQLQLAQDRFAEAEATCRKILRLDIKNQDAQKALVQISIKKNQPDQALIYLTGLGGPSSKDSAIHNMLGLVALMQGDRSAALFAWKQAISLNSSDISARMNLGVMYLSVHMPQQAAIQFERVLKVAPDHSDAKLHLAIVQGSRGQHEAAIKVYEELLDQNEKNPLILYNLAVSQKASGKLTEAVSTIKTYLKSKQQKPSDSERALAMIEEIQSQQESTGKKVSDEDIRKLAERSESEMSSDQSDDVDRSDLKKGSPNRKSAIANELASDPLTDKSDLKASSNVPKANETKRVPSSLGANEGIDDLEKQLLAH